VTRDEIHLINVYIFLTWVTSFMVNFQLAVATFSSSCSGFVALGMTGSGLSCQ